MMKAIKGCCSINLKRKYLDEALKVLSWLFKTRFTFQHDFREGWSQYISSVVLNNRYPNSTRVKAANVSIVDRNLNWIW